MNDSNAVVFTVTANPLPLDWWDQDVGIVSYPGTATYTNGTFTVGGTYSINQVTTDSFHYVYKTLTGDGTIVARVAGVSNGYAWVGIMMRNSLDAGSRSLFIGRYAGGTNTLYRTS